MGGCWIDFGPMRNEFFIRYSTWSPTTWTIALLLALFQPHDSLPTSYYEREFLLEKLNAHRLLLTYTFLFGLSLVVFKMRLLRICFHTLIENGSFSSLTDVGSHNPFLLEPSVPVGTRSLLQLMWDPPIHNTVTNKMEKTEERDVEMENSETKGKPIWSMGTHSFLFLYRTYTKDRRRGRSKYGAEKPKSIWMEDASFTCFSRAVEGTPTMLRPKIELYRALTNDPFQGPTSLLAHRLMSTPFEVQPSYWHTASCSPPSGLSFLAGTLAHVHPSGLSLLAGTSPYVWL